jgi:uncharacterized protein (TIGR00255 family)
MLKSMTGFGNATVETPNLTVTAEIKTLNSKFLDIFCRLPRQFSDKEIELRNLLTQNLERGKVELSVNVARSAGEKPSLVVNRPLVAGYVNDLQEASKAMYLRFSDDAIMKLALAQPNAFHSDSLPNADDIAADWQTVLAAVNEALIRCNEFRLQEGASLDGKLTEYITAIANGLATVEEHDVHRIPAVRERLQATVQELLGSDDFDRNRFEQELIYYIEKFDISEEKVRLKNHLDYFREVLQTEEANGKKLNFIAQEIGREINTIGSKANDATIQRVVIGMKDELEKIKEQTMNVI